MRRISGYVLVQETNVGIPNLVVAAYDSPICDRGEPSQASLSQVFERAGRKLTSILTGRDGAFTIDGDSLAFQGNEQRPNLLLVVFAPEDVQDDANPFPLPPEARILYFSIVPRCDAGAEEAFVIRLRLTQLQKFHIHTSASDPDADVHRLASSVERAWSTRDALRARLGPRVAKEREARDAARAIATQRVGRLTGIPKHLRNREVRNSDFLILDKSSVATELPRLQAKAVSDGLTRLSGSSYQGSLRLWLTKQDLTDLGLRVDDHDTVVGSAESAEVASKVRALNGGLDLTRRRQLTPPSPDELESRYLFPSDNTKRRTRKPNTPVK